MCMDSQTVRDGRESILESGAQFHISEDES